MTLPAHDDDRCARIYQDCKPFCVGFARRRLASSGGRNRYLLAFDAEEFYDAAWETYYQRREYLEEGADHIARINALIDSRLRDERRRSRAQKRTAPGRLVGLDAAESAGVSDRPGTRRRARTGAGTPVSDGDDGLASRLADRDELRHLLARVANPADARALVDHEMRGLTFEEIGANEGISAEAARRRAQRAKAQARPQTTRDARHEP